MIQSSVLVTGASGFIGRHVVRHLTALGHKVTALDYRHPIEPFPPGVRFEHCDIRRKVFPKRHFHAVVHLAALAGVRPSLDRPFDYEETNSMGTLYLLEFCRIHGIRNVVFASSSSIYGPNKALPSVESDPPNPLSPYALSKIHGEQWGDLYGRIHGIHFVALRFFTVWGDGQRHDLALARFTRQLLNGEPVQVNGDGTQRRDLTHVSDVCRAIALSVHWPAPGPVTFNIGTGTSHSVLDMVMAAEDWTGKKAEIRHGFANPADVPETLADNSLARSVLGWTPSVCFPKPPN